MKKNNVTFKYCGLNKKNNFLEAPICPCGCGNRISLVLENDNDVFDFMYTMLDEHECNHCAIFALKNDGHILIALKFSPDEIQCYVVRNNNVRASRWRNVFAGLQSECEFHCYGLLEQVDNEHYKIVMD